MLELLLYCVYAAVFVDCDADVAADCDCERVSYPCIAVFADDGYMLAVVFAREKLSQSADVIVDGFKATALSLSATLPYKSRSR